MREKTTRFIGGCAPFVVLASVAAWACGGGGGLVEAPSLPTGAKFAVLPLGEDAGDGSAGTRRPSTSSLKEGDVFRGTSYCRVGQVTVVLRITELDADDVRGNVEIASQRGGARGTYQVSGTYTASNRHVKLEGGDWIDEADELEAADLEGTLTATGFQARLGMSGCGSVSLKRDGAP